MKTRIVSLLILLSATFIITESCNNTTTKNAEAVLIDSVAETSETFEEKGLRLAMSTKAILAKNLMLAIQQKGPENAVEFCNTKALHLTDSTAALNASIKRVSDKPRNKNNKANEQEEAFINKLKTQLANGEKPVAETHETADKIIGYYAIETNKMCLQCHGAKDKDINAATLRKINSLYPDDKATGYAENQIRGIWVVEMKK